MLQIRIKQGKGGQFRWLLYEDGVFAGMSHIQGYASRSLAEQAAQTAFRGMGGTAPRNGRSRP